MENWQERCEIIQKNHDKWAAARQYAYDNGMIFKVLTENEIFTNT